MKNFALISSKHSKYIERCFVDIWPETLYRKEIANWILTNWNTGRFPFQSRTLKVVPILVVPYVTFYIDMHAWNISSKGMKQYTDFSKDVSLINAKFFSSSRLLILLVFLQNLLTHYFEIHVREFFCIPWRLKLDFSVLFYNPTRNRYSCK